MAQRNFLGEKFGRLVVTGEAQPNVRSYPGRAVHRERRLECSCDCGGRTVASAGHLTCGRTHSCGCLRQEVTGAKRRRHGESHHTPEYAIWKSMRQRCDNPHGGDYHLYGGRGIQVCDRWQTFENFLADMGRRPSPRHSIDRFPDNDGNYEPTNCRWATPSEQRRNQRPRGGAPAEARP